uniref:Fucolectin tachylectin-4 pentraxin-1 domain-containing protein n=1 Tax=Cyprinus carpio TaxID=7962 RepID=A0A8C1JQ74_CYPCA
MYLLGSSLLVSQVVSHTLFFTNFLGNWASRGTVIQSSTSADMFAEKAIDGNRGLQQLDTGCSSTLNQTNPWWRVDLAHIYKVSRVVVTNRNDCCTEQINGAEIRIGNSLENNGNNNPICAIIPAIPAGEFFSYSCGGMEGRYVNLIIPGDMKILTLCEVEVFGKGILYLYYLGNKLQYIAENHNIFQIRAVDGDRGTCSHTSTGTNQWWRLELWQEFQVDTIAITNADSPNYHWINGAVIRVGTSPTIYSNPVCAVISTIPSGQTSNFSCGWMEGRYMFVHIPGDQKTLVLCDVKIYGYLTGNIY